MNTKKKRKTGSGADGLAKSVLQALQFLKCRGAGMLIRGGVMKHWTEHFCDSLETAGYEIDRDAVRKMHGFKRQNQP